VPRKRVWTWRELQQLGGAWVSDGGEYDEPGVYPPGKEPFFGVRLPDGSRFMAMGGGDFEPLSARPFSLNPRLPTGDKRRSQAAEEHYREQCALTGNSPGQRRLLTSYRDRMRADPSLLFLSEEDFKRFKAKPGPKP